MGLAREQALLARLYVDGSYRERFFADPATVGQEANLPLARIEAISRCEVEIRAFAHSLIHKRLVEIRGLLPATERALGDRFGPLARTYLEQHPPGGLDKPAEDARGLSRALTALSDGEIPPWISELARYEGSRLIEEAGGLRVLQRLVIYRFPVVDLQRSLLRGDPLGTPRPRLTLVLEPVHRRRA